MEISRQRIGQSIYETFYSKCDCCSGDGFKKTSSILIYNIISDININLKIYGSKSKKLNDTLEFILNRNK